MKAIEKAAHEAAADYFEKLNRDGYGTRKVLSKIIAKHLAPVQAELDAKDKMLQEAREIIKGRTMNGCDCSVCEEAQDWLARVNPGDRKGSGGEEIQA